MLVPNSQAVHTDVGLLDIGHAETDQASPLLHNLNSCAMETGRWMPTRLMPSGTDTPPLPRVPLLSSPLLTPLPLSITTSPEWSSEETLPRLLLVKSGDLMFLRTSSTL